MSPAKRTVTTLATNTTTDAAALLQRLDLLPIQAALQTFAQLEADLCGNLIERDEAVRAALCVLIAGQNMVLIGLPGTAKTHPWLYLHWVRPFLLTVVVLFAASHFCTSLRQYIRATLQSAPRHCG